LTGGDDWSPVGRWIGDRGRLGSTGKRIYTGSPRKTPVTRPELVLPFQHFLNAGLFVRDRMVCGVNG